MDNFKIEGNQMYQVMFELLLTIASEQKAMMSFLLDEDLKKRDGSFEKTTAALEEAKQFYRGQLLVSLYQDFASLKDLLPPKVDPSE